MESTHLAHLFHSLRKQAQVVALNETLNRPYLNHLLMPKQFSFSFLFYYIFKSRKNHTSSSRPRTRFVPINDEAEQDIQCVHRIRSRSVSERTALINGIRGLLYEYGIFHPQGVRNIKKFLAEVSQ